MSGAKAPLGFGLYFMDVLACMLFSIVLALTSASFDREALLPVVLPTLERSSDAPLVAPELGAQWITLREEAGGVQLYLGDEAIELATLTERLEAAPPPSVILRTEESLLARLIALAHGAGVGDVQVAYEPKEDEP